MAKLAEQIAEVRNELARLERLAASATCAEVGHRWASIGGANCGCHPYACCSVPVMECTVCKACDYGDGDEADEQRRRCLDRKDFEALASLPQSSAPDRGEG